MQYTNYFILLGLFLKGFELVRIPLINNGNEIEPITHLSYMASLQVVRTEEFICGGIFISPKTVLSLATCFFQSDVRLNPEEIMIVAGSAYRLDENSNTLNAVLEEILLHENFSRSSLENNLGVGILENSINQNTIEYIALHDIALEPPIEGTKCQIYGWSLSTRFEGSPHLLTGEVEITAREKCDVPSNKITSTTLCAGPYFIDGCETDSGSPLICNDKLYGLIDYRSSEYCSVTMTNRLGTYVDLSEFHEWVAEQTSSSEKNVCSLLLVAILLIVNINCD